MPGRVVAREVTLKGRHGGTKLVERALSVCFGSLRFGGLAPRMLALGPPDGRVKPGASRLPHQGTTRRRIVRTGRISFSLNPARSSDLSTRRTAACSRTPVRG